MTMDIFRIGLCDDEQIERNLLETYIQEWSAQRNHPVAVSSFSGGLDLLQAYKRNLFDLFLLDIQMQEPDGMCIAKEIRKNDHDTGIFFITGYEDYLEEGYEAEAFRYLLKPVSKEKLWDAFDKFLLRKKKAQRFWVLDTPAGQKRVALDEILYLESFGHTCSLYAISDSFVVKAGISEMERQMQAAGLNAFRCHRSYLINIAQMTGVEREYAVMANGQKVPVSRKLYHPLSQAFIRHFKNIFD